MKAGKKDRMERSVKKETVLELMDQIMSDITNTFSMQQSKYLVGDNNEIKKQKKNMFYGPVNLMRLCRVQSIYLTTLLLGRLRPLSS